MSAPSDPLAPIRAVDAAGQLADVLALPDHLRDAIWRVESAGLAGADAGCAVVCGMGGSAIGGDLAAAALGERLHRPLHTVRGYALPPWLPDDAGVLCSSYSGNTEETLSCYEAARAAGLHTIVATTGGALADAARRDGVAVIGVPSSLQPRASVGYMLTIAAEAAALFGAATSIRPEIEAAAAHLEASAEAIARRSAELSATLEGAVPVIYGAGLTAPIAFRWKTQVNENAKWPAFASQLPEANHNEIVGWDGLEAGAGAPFSAILLADRDQHPRERLRIELTAKLVEPHATAVHVLETEGETRTERLLGMVALGDLVSLQLTAQRGLDPSPVETIDRLKAQLGT